MKLLRLFPALALAMAMLYGLPSSVMAQEETQEENFEYSIFIPVVADSVNLSLLADQSFADNISLDRLESKMDNLSESELNKFYEILDAKASLAIGSTNDVNAAYWPGDAKAMNYKPTRIELVTYFRYGGGGSGIRPSYWWYSTTWCDGDPDPEMIMRFDLGKYGVDVDRLKLRSTDVEITSHLQRVYGGALNAWRFVHEGAVNDRYLYVCVGSGGYGPFGSRTAYNMWLKLQ